MLFRSTAVTVNNPDAINITATMPTGVTDGDALVLSIMSDTPGFAGADIVVSGLPGWSEVTPLPQGANVVIRAFTKVASSEPASYSVDTGGQGVTVCRVTAYDPEGGVVQFDDTNLVTDDAGTNTTLASPSVDVLSGGVLHCEWGVDAVRTVTTSPTGMSLIGTSDGASATLSTWYEATSGTGVTRSLQWSSAEQLVGVAVAMSAPSASSARTTYVRSGVGNATATSVTIGSVIIDGSSGALLVHTFNRNAGAGTVTGVILREVGGGVTVGTFTEFDTLRALGFSEGRSWRLTTGSIANGTYEILVSLSGSRQTTVSWQYRTGVDQTTPLGTPVFADGVLTAGTATTDDQDLISVAWVEESTLPVPPLFVATGTGQTERTDSGQSAQFQAVGEQNSTGSPITAAWTFEADTMGGEARAALVYPVNGISAAAGPTINSQPANLSIPVGETATLHADVTGEGDVTYQWQFSTGGAFANVTDGVGGTAASYTSRLLAAGDDQIQYQFIATDDNGPVTSDPATITVTAVSVPRITILFQGS